MDIRLTANCGRPQTIYYNNLKMIKVDGINMELEFYVIAVLFSIVGFYFAIRAFLKVKNTPDDIFRAKVFLNKNFLRNNLTIVFIVGVLVLIHTILELAQYRFVNPLKSTVYLLYSLTLPIIALFVAFLAYHWNKAFYKKNEMFGKTK
ncbi:MAG: hypothetical protein O8C61_02255 [Candidatus Methanoperedens sp.]|nr:hypothetical protein [Candidatus Methanoperedens sp.]